MKHYLIVDIGTGNSRVALVSEAGDILDLRHFENRYHRDDLYEDAQYFSPDYLQEQILDACRDLIESHPDIKIDAITSSGARQSCVLLGKDGENVIGLPNIDNRAKGYLDHIPDKETIYHQTGSWVTEDCIASKIYALKLKRPDIYEKVKTFTSLSEWVGWFLTGISCIEPSQATETLLFDLKTKQFSKDLLRVFDLTGLELQEIKRAGEKLGDITDPIKQRLGIDYDVPFIVGGADTQIALKGAGIEEGDIGVVSGTTSPVVALTKTLYTDKDLHCWTGCYLKGDLYQVETNPGVTGLNYQRIRNLLFDKVTYEDLEYAMTEVKEVKCIAFFTSLDFENASGYPTGGFFMRPPFQQDLHREDMAWAIVADIACAIYHQYLQLQTMVPDQKDHIVACGGGFQSKMLCQCLADLTGKKLYLPKHFEQASVLGAAMVCNEYYDISRSTSTKGHEIVPSEEEGMIHGYYKEWERYRRYIITARREL